MKFFSLDNEKSVKKKAICVKLFWYKDFVHGKSTLLNFLMDSVLNFREKYIDNFGEILMACPPPPLVFLKVLFFSSAGKNLY